MIWRTSNAVSCENADEAQQHNDTNSVNPRNVIELCVANEAVAEKEKRQSALVRWLAKRVANPAFSPRMRRFLRLRAIVLFVAVTSLIIEHARAGSETAEQKDSLRLRDLGTQRLTVGQISPVAQPEPSATPTPEPTLPSSQFNPDPGSGKEEIPIEPPILFPPVVPEPPEYGEEPLPRSLELPRKGVRETVPRRRKLEYETYPESEEGEGVLPNSEAGAESLVHRVRPLEAIRRSLH